MRLSRRTLLHSSVAAAAVSVIPGCSREVYSGPVEGAASGAGKLLDEALSQMLTSYPESASSSGVDTGERGGLKFKLSDRSPEGQAAIESAVRELAGKFAAVDTGALEAEQAGHVNVVGTVYQTSAEGFDFPFGDMALLNSNWSYRNAPYTVAQNTGAFVEIPKLSSIHLTRLKRLKTRMLILRGWKPMQTNWMARASGCAWKARRDGSCRTS